VTDTRHTMAPHRERLLALPGVVGVGSGIHTPDGAPVLVAMLDADPAGRADLPAEVGGIPVRYEVIGRIVALEEQ
jgi:hypothetical protein